MADFAPPPGPPPPKVPEGWKAIWNDQYKEWFYVNTFTKASQWDKPTEPSYGPSGGAPPSGAPPGYVQNTAQSTGPEKGGFSNNPYNQQSNVSDDEALARRLQAEEESRAGGADRGASDSYYGQGSGGAPAYGQSASPYGQQNPSPYGQQSTPSYGQQELPPREEKSKGLFGKLSSKFGGGSSQRPPQQGYGGYPQQQYGRYPQQGYPPQQYGGYPPQQGYAQQPQKHGMGGLGAGVLGAGAGLVGGALLMDAVEDHDQNEYDQGYQQGADNGGGGDDGGGYGGDDGGGDFGGGDDGGGDF